MPGVTDRYRDSVSSSNSFYTNPYREDFDYRRAERARNVSSRAIDKMETTQEKIERELLEKLLAKKDGLTPDSLIVILQKIGKFTFLALMLPPYVLLYGIPKLGMKKLASLVKTVIDYASLYLNKAASISSLYLTRIYTWPQAKILFLINKTQEKIRNVSQAISQVVRQRFLNPIQSFTAKQKNRIVQAYFKVVSPLQQFVKNAAQKAYSFIPKMPKISFTLPSFKVSLPKLSLPDWTEAIKDLRIKWDELTKSSKKKVQEAVTASWKMIEASWLFLWQPLTQIKLPNYRLPNFASAIKNIYKNVSQAISRFTKPFVDAASNVKYAVRKTYEALSAALRKSLQNAAKVFSRYVAKGKELKQKALSFLKRWAYLPNKGKEKWQQLKKRIKETLSNIPIRQIASRSLTWLQKILKAIGTFMKNFFMTLRILYALICLLVKFAAQGIREKIAQEINN